VRARDLAVEYETVGLDSDALGAARLMAAHRLPALLVVDEQGARRRSCRHLR
jgi:CBS domain-containing protein